MQHQIICYGCWQRCVQVYWGTKAACHPASRQQIQKTMELFSKTINAFTVFVYINYKIKHVYLQDLKPKQRTFTTDEAFRRLYIWVFNVIPTLLLNVGQRKPFNNVWCILFASCLFIVHSGRPSLVVIRTLDISGWLGESCYPL